MSSASSSGGVKRQRCDNARGVTPRGSVSMEMPHPPPGLTELGHGSLELAESHGKQIVQNAFQCLPTKYMGESILAFDWTEQLDSNAFNEDPYLGFVNDWLLAGTFPVTGRNSKGTNLNAISKKFRTLGKNIHDTLKAASRRRSVASSSYYPLEVRTRFFQLYENLLYQMPGAEPKAHWARAHIPALTIQLWKSLPKDVVSAYTEESISKAICKSWDICVLDRIGGDATEDEVVCENARLNAFAQFLP